MWLKDRVGLLEAEVKMYKKLVDDLRYKHQRLLDHLELAEWEVPSTPAKTEIITKEEWEKRNKENLARQQTYSDWQRQLGMQAQLSGTLFGQGRIY